MDGYGGFNLGKDSASLLSYLWDSTLAQASVQAVRRSALVIGNGAYTEGPLSNAVNDAEAVARTLQEIGFAVTLRRNADKRTIDEAVEAFSRQLEPGEIGLFYFAGHGVQVTGENYLVPINALLSRQADVQYDAVPLGKVINALEATRATAKIIILDACRDNPFYRRWRSTSRGISTRGLAVPETAGSGGTLIAFSTAPGKVASDGIANSPNSPFTTHLLQQLRTPNLVCCPATNCYNMRHNRAVRFNACRKTDAALEAFQGRASTAAEYRQFTLNATLNRAASTDRACLWRR
jgi:Uncharacterized protein containing caspase domain